MLRISLVYLALLAASFVEAKRQLIDDASADLESIVQTVCETKRGTSLLIGRGTTIARLDLYLSNLSSDHEFAACASKYGQSIKQLANLLSTNNENVCSEGKLEAIEQFHRDYVSMRPKHVENRKSRNLNIPRLVKLFFMSYAAEVSSICARDSMKQLETLKYNSGDDQKDLPEIDSMLGRFADFFGINQLGKGYSEVFLPWLMIDGLPLEKHPKLNAYISLVGDKKLFMKTKDPAQLVNLQVVCRDLMRPIYGRVLLPVMRLISLGYYPANQELAEQLGQQSTLRRVYVSTQLCESVLPIQLFADPTMKPEQTVLLTPEEAASLPKQQVSASQSILTGDQIGLTEPLNSLTNFEITLASRNIDDIKANVHSRSKSLSRVLKIMARTISGQLKDKMKKIFFGSEKREQLVEEDVNSLTQGEFQLDVEEEEVDGLVRRKRFFKEIGAVIKFFIKVIGAIIFAVIIIVIFLFQLAVVCPFYYLYRFFRYVTGYAVGDIETVLEAGINLLASEDSPRRIDMTYDGPRDVRYIGPHKRY